MTDSFVLDPRLQNDTIDCGDLKLCRLLLMNDSRYPWFILVPRRSGVTELHQLCEQEQSQFLRESRALSLWMENYFPFDKLNVAALGNVVSQLHIHHVGRFVDDPAWPGPVWGHSPAVPYDSQQKERLRQAAADALLLSD